MEPITITATVGVIWNIVQGLLGDQINDEIVNKLIKKNIKNWVKKTSRPTNHDIEKAVRLASLNATLVFLKEYIENNKESKIFIKTTPKELKEINKYLQIEKKNVSKPNFIPPELLFDYEIEDLLNPKNFANIKMEFEKNVISELQKNVENIPIGFKNTIINGIKISDNTVSWYSLMSSFFIETIKTNERVKTAIENDFLTEIKKDVKQHNLVLNLSLSNISNQISKSNQRIIDRIDGIDIKLDVFFDQLISVIDKKGVGIGLSPEIRNKKSKILRQIEKLINFVLALQKDEDDFSKMNDMSSTFDDIDFDDIMDALRNETCILFIGPEISIDENGNSLHENYFKSISNNRIKYNSEDNFFLPGAENKIINKAKQFYSNIFPSLNIKGNTILEKLAQIPFKLIISYAPDDSLSRIYTKHNIKHSSYEYIADTETVVERESDLKIPIIYNAFGNAAKNGKYIYSHRQFNKFSKAEPQKRIPINIESELAEGTNYLFIGFDFNKWYFRAMMFDLNIMEFAERIVLDANKTKTFNKDFIKKQFDVSFIDTDYDNLTTVLLKKSQEASLSKSLNSVFSKSILNELETIRLKSLDTDKLEVLTELISEIEDIEKKIIENKE